MKNTARRKSASKDGKTASPSDYDPQTQMILETIYETPRRVLIDTVDQKRFGKKYRYVLLKKSEKWLIDSKKFYAFDGKLENYFL